MTDQMVSRLGELLRALPTAKGGLLVLIAVGAAVVALVFSHTTQMYFRDDEWAYWTFRRDLLNAGGERNLIDFFLSPHGGSPHSGAIPAGLMAIWLPLDYFFGMHSYWPYAAPSLLFHLLAAALMYRLLAGYLRPRVALGAASLFLILGNAASLVTYGWVTNFVAPIAATFGVQLAIDKLETRNYKVAVLTTGGATLAAIAFSMVGLVTATVAATGYALRRRWWTAGFHLGGTAILVTLWRAAYNPSGVAIEPATPDHYVGFVWDGLTTAGGNLTGLGSTVGALVVVAAAAGVLWVWRVRDPASLAVVPAFIGALVFYAMVAARGVDLPSSFSFDQDRFLYVATALLLPALAWLIDKLISITRWMTWASVLLLMWAVSTNVRDSLNSFDDAISVGGANRITIETAASLVGHLEPLQAGFLVADGTRRFSVAQFELLHAQGKVPCATDVEAALRFVERQNQLVAHLEFEPMPMPVASQIRCD